MIFGTVSSRVTWECVGVNDWSKLELQKRDRRIETLMGLRGTLDNF